MSMDPSKLRDEALGILDDDDDALDATEHEAALGAEIAERIRQVDAGEVQTVPWSEARSRITRED